MGSDMRTPSDSPPRPPLYVRWILRLLLNRDDRHMVTSDLSELYEHRRARDGDRAAAAWLRRQLASYPYRLLADRLRRAAPSPARYVRTGEPDSNRAGESVRNLFRDLRHSVRSLVRTPALSATIVATVGLGIGATAAIFSVINAVLLQPLPYSNPSQLVRIYTDAPPNRWGLSVADYLALDEQQTSFSHIAGYTNSTITFNRGDHAERVRGKFVTWTYFPLLGISPLRGRSFSESDGVPGTEPRVVVSHGFASRHLDGIDAAIGKTVRFDGRAYTVIGVLPRTVGPFEQDRAFFAAAQWEAPPRRGPFFIVALGRLRSDSELSVAAEELRVINRRIFPIWQDTYQDEKASWGMMDLKEVVVGDVGTTLVIVLGAVAFLLIIASTNAANLLLARATQRSRELAVRAALGASRARLLQHLLVESGLLAVGGAILGLAVTVGGIELFTTVGADFIPRTREIGLNGPVLWFLTALTAASVLLFGLIPSLHGSKSRFDRALRSGGRSSTDAAGPAGPRRLRRALVVSQFAVAAPLLIGAGLLIGSLANLGRVDPGFDSHNILTAGISLPAANYSAPSDVAAFWSEATSRIRALPGVEAVAVASGRPPNQFRHTNDFVLEDKPTPPGASPPAVPFLSVTPDYFDALGIPVIQGRVFTDRDDFAGPDVAIVDETWARRFFPNESAVGRRFYEGGCTPATCSPVTVVGVVGDVTYTGLENPGEGTVYQPMLRGIFLERSGYVFVRTPTDAMTVLPSVRNVVRELDPTLPLSSVATIDERLADSLDTPRYLTILVSAFAAVALALSIIGIYGVMSNFVQRHARDIGIRIALGGTPSNVLHMIVRQGMQLVVVGMIAGIAAALILTRFMSSLLFEVGATDVLTFASVAALMLGVALVACFVPALRAAGVDPVRTLREE